MNAKTRVRAFIVIAAGLIAAHGPVVAQQSGQVMIDVSECIRLDAPDARLACYEARVAALFRERATQAAAASPAPPSVSAAPAARPAEPGPAAVSAPRAPATPPAASAPAAPATPSPERTANVPVTPPAAAPPFDRRAERRRSEEQEAPVEVVSVIRELREIVPNTYLVTLENGQVWRQTESKQYPLRPGLKVRIYGTRWGSASRLSADEIKSYIQVERVR